MRIAIVGPFEHPCGRRIEYPGQTTYEERFANKSIMHVYVLYIIYLYIYFFQIYIYTFIFKYVLFIYIFCTYIIAYLSQ